MSTQLSMLAVEAPLAAPGCEHTNPLGACAACAAIVAELCAGFAADVAAGRCDSEGFTVNERRKGAL